MDDCSIFVYIDGNPTKGCWMDIDELTDDDDVREALAEAGVFDDLIPEDCDDMETARGAAATDYGGDILIADVEGFARPFLSQWGIFDWDNFKKWAEYLDRNKHVDEDALIAFFDWMSVNEDVDYFEEAYQGTHKSKEDWAESFMNDVYDIPSHLENYIDYARFARDCEMDGYYFAEVAGGVAVFRSH